MTSKDKTTDMHDHEPTATGAAADAGAETTDETSAALGARRRAAIAKLGRMAAFSSPVLMTLLMSERAAADSPPADPVGGF